MGSLHRCPKETRLRRDGLHPTIGQAITVRGRIIVTSPTIWTILVTCHPDMRWKSPTKVKFTFCTLRLGSVHGTTLAFPKIWIWTPSMEKTVRVSMIFWALCPLAGSVGKRAPVAPISWTMPVAQLNSLIRGCTTMPICVFFCLCVTPTLPTIQKIMAPQVWPRIWSPIRAKKIENIYFTGASTNGIEARPLPSPPPGASSLPDPPQHQPQAEVEASSSSNNNSQTSDQSVSVSNVRAVTSNNSVIMPAAAAALSQQPSTSGTANSAPQAPDLPTNNRPNSHRIPVSSANHIDNANALSSLISTAPKSELKKEKISPDELPQYKRDLVAKIKVLRSELSALQPASGT